MLTLTSQKVKNKNLNQKQNRIFAENTFVTRIKTNTQYQSTEELELPLTPIRIF